MPTLDLTPVEEADLAWAVAPEFRTAHEADTALAFNQEDEPWRRPKVHKLVHLLPAVEFVEPQVVGKLHVMNRTLTPATEADSAQAVTAVTGDITFKTLVPAFESG